MFYPGSFRKVLAMSAPFLVCITQIQSGKPSRNYHTVNFKNMCLFLIEKRTNKPSPEYDSFLFSGSFTTIISQKGGTALSCLLVLFFYGIKSQLLMIIGDLGIKM